MFIGYYELENNEPYFNLYYKNESGWRKWHVVPIKFDRVCYIEESVGYWRKANAIHNWFVANCDKRGVDYEL